MLREEGARTSDIESRRDDLWEELGFIRADIVP